MSQQTSFQQSSESSYHQQQSGGMDTHDQSTVKNLVNKFDNSGSNNDQMQQYQQSSTTTTSSATPLGVSQSELIDFESAEEHERRARELREKALTTLKTNEEEFAQAERAQALAKAAAAQANVKTSQALENQERGQQLLAEAGARLIEAGAKLQQEAASIKREVPFNVHQQGEVRQTTCVSAAGVEAAAHAREVATFREVEQPQVVGIQQSPIAQTSINAGNQQQQQQFQASSTTMNTEEKVNY